MARTRKERRSSSGREALRKNGMMAHLLDSLDAGQDIGHFGRLVFAMVARYFMDDEELRQTLMQDPACDERQAVSLVEQVKGRDYSPPRREKVLQFQAQQEFPLCPNAEDPDACNVYKDLQFPESVYEHITDYREQKAHVHEDDTPSAGHA
ncbi:hypothetical protein [Archangium sp.]|uniref:hypothetical protein n=1 Tax=Archangium sp. TaxID=1872627 RepID=UPI00389B254E